MPLAVAAATNRAINTGCSKYMRWLFVAKESDASLHSSRHLPCGRERAPIDMATVRNADERLIILLPPDLLEEVRRAAEEADLSVSQIVRRAIRNELKLIAREKAAPDTRITLDYVGRVFEAAAKSGLLTGGVIPGIDSAFDAKKIVRKRPR